ncbi:MULTISPECIES: S-methyl-5-thioribose-1-phosphate isomerase [Methylococcus]|uniref:Methylthioribose-1-phosphate isomerase n=2 Tax=Methylococcus capsulatus TaxID=414 RepID=MTNA_METCA|nr:S-methyl-5-thioribose-1-phosphate isomerase [Methylococcus capsulatus]Q606P2.1 RecName: Full=Methylthioribose-1-phosphate isomerase; Short=M1Pi; Short=MTR-1-P isomerase; AltName: Full=S-methyl-5-thioribose-1-phosphate isomerase [Methylococcus capsulatus str. Bath]AAU92002.1 initiation factor 2 subunit family protein [Methylococcus capsulatus str. Bath]QXP87401.1 S-methyl-5-thioribose-1-phosphate isomerase [Methylococcus capsulatus]QXP92858.1 S-methyl-5-thioribose-1-phosphate isomerase [Methy
MSDHSFSAVSAVQALKWSDGGLEVLDQRLLPGDVVYQIFDTAAGVAEAIASMRVRGAPAIGIAAAYGVVLGARAAYARDPAHWKRAVEDDIAVLARSRPTAVNLFWALERMREAMAAIEGDPVPALLAAARRIHEDDLAANLAMGELGAAILGGCKGVLTHCNTGALATGGYGTALGVIRSTWRRGALERVYATETRPWSQGARLTVWELGQDRIPATLLADSAAAWLMKSGAVQWVVVGADRIAANGDVANKIGTYSLAVLARHHGVKLMVVAPISTVDWATATGEDIVVEERDPRELLHPLFLGSDSVIGAWNPVFDVTPAALIDAIVTEAGVVTNPSPDTMATLRGKAR